MYVVTFEERYKIGDDIKWIESSRILKTLNEVRSVVCIFYDSRRNDIRNIKVWESLETEYRTTTMITFEDD